MLKEILITAVEVYGLRLLKRAAKKRMKKSFRKRSTDKLHITQHKLWERAYHAPRGLRETPERIEVRKGRLVVQEHSASHHHYDVSIVDDDGRELYRGARTASELSDIFPKKGTHKKWVQQPEHRVDYLDFEGTIPKGQYGAGEVTKALDIPIDITKTYGGRIEFNVYDGDYKGKYAMLQTSNVDWLIVAKKPSDLKVNGKLTFKSAKPDEVLSTKEVRFEHKADGHHENVKITKGEAHFWSHRISKRTGGPIVHDDNLPINRYVKGLDGTEFRAELVYVDKGIRKEGKIRVTRRASFLPRLDVRISSLNYYPIGAERPSWLAGRLNSKPWKAKQDFANGTGELGVVILAVNRYKGKKVSHLNYDEQRRMKEELAQEIDWAYVPRSFEDGHQAWQVIVDEEGREGLVMYNPNLGVAEPDTGIKLVKIKNNDHVDCRIIGWQPMYTQSPSSHATKKWDSKRDIFTYEDKDRIGALLVETEDGKVFEVGNGFTDAQRHFYAQNIDTIIEDESIIKVMYDPKLEERKGVHAPRYDGVHTGKSDGILQELNMYEYADYDKNAVYAMKASAGYRR